MAAPAAQAATTAVCCIESNGVEDFWAKANLRAGEHLVNAIYYDHNNNYDSAPDDDNHHNDDYDQFKSTDVDWTNHQTGCGTAHAHRRSWFHNGGAFGRRRRCIPRHGALRIVLLWEVKRYSHLQ